MLAVVPSFAIDWLALIISCFFIAGAYLFYLSSRLVAETPCLLFSDLTNLKTQPKSFKIKLSNCARYLQYAAIAAFLAAFIDPKIFVPKEISQGAESSSNAVEGIAMYFVLDQSGSMAEIISPAFLGGNEQSLSKIEFLKSLTMDFIKGNPALGLSGRQNDMIGLIAFARIPEVLVPLTLEHQTVLDDIKKLEVVHSRDREGTGIGYAIYKTANLIAAVRHFSEELAKGKKPVYDIKNTIMILVTDGLQEPNPEDQKQPLRTMDIPEAAEFAKTQGVRLYIVNLEPKLATEELAPFRHQMQQAAELTGGKFFFVTSSTNLSQIYSEIDQLEKSELPMSFERNIPRDKQPDLFNKISFYPYLIALGLFCLFLSILLQTIYAKKVL
jgi:Ca-activated chloride channel homolog